jgi:hypothetical protein
VTDLEKKVFGPRLDLDAIDRITAVVGITAAIDRQALLDDLESALAIYRTGVMRREHPAQREQTVARIVGALERGRKLLGGYIETYGAMHLRRQCAVLGRLLEDIRKEDSPGLNRLIEFKQPTTVSAVEQLVHGLAGIFECHYEIKAGYTDGKTGLSTGHFVDFADAVLQAAGIHYDRPSITRTLRKRP